VKISGWMSNRIHMPPYVKRDTVLLPALFILNFFFFSTWIHLGQVATRPWLILVWLYGLAILVPLAWRDKAPVAVFTIQWVLTVSAWPIMPLYIPVVGIPTAVHAVSVHRSRKISLLALLASVIPIGLDVAVGFQLFLDPALQLRWIIPNATILVFMTVGAWAAGRVTRASQQHVQHLEHERETVQEAVAAERRRIVRELHDVVSETTGKKAMAELRRILRLLEASDPPSHAAGIGEPRAVTGLGGPDRAAHLITRHRNAGDRARRGDTM
jgi:signal transduction histidine kinase